jgi:plasmid maintenance system antidote protein VapI
MWQFADMSSKLLREWMDRNDKTVQDIAYALQIHPQTVYRYLNGKAVHRSTRAALERLVNTTEQTPRVKVAQG